ncbi:fimbrial protein [Dysgonomonas sp. HGC4]|uniref:fimbrial protein n=1 Tax=Dysgonomonas sp. HGC4 TaxID=1658009 RepID=UPI000683671B|nr:fimbrial protein [Dysgonomonas sp. HGC4]MBD8347901.1 DUF4906 domain-containing protein [Dysgonomonas sp. HGC4]
MKQVCQKKSKANTRVFFILLGFVLLTIIPIFTSCNKDDDGNGEFGSKNVKVQFYTTNLSFVRQTSNESQINEVQAMVFIDNGDGGGYKYNYSVEGTSLTHSDTLSTTFDLEIYTEERPVKIFIFANSNGIISNNIPLVGETENEVKQKLIKPVTSTNITGNFPMWGEYLLPSGISSTLNNTITQLKVLRSIARIDVSTTKTPSDFTMTSIQAFRVNSQIQIAPNNYTGSLLVSDPSIPISSVATITTIPIPVIANNSESQLYLPESEAPTSANQVAKATCVIVGGRYKGSATVTYYRIDIEPNIAGYPSGQILRNHHYTLNIVNVSAPGWPTPEEAAENISTNIEVGVQDWTDANINVGLDGNDYFRLSSRNLEIERVSGSTTYTFVATSVLDYTIQWSDAQGNPLPQTSPGEVIDDGVLRVTKSRNIITVEAIADNPSTNSILRYFLIVAKRAHIVVSVVHAGI